MNVVRPAFPIPIILIDGFLHEANARRILEQCITLRPAYTDAKVYYGPYTTRIDHKVRKNEVVYIGRASGDVHPGSEIANILHDKIWTTECRTLWHKGYYLFDIINYATHHEAVLSRYGNNDFYKRHQDTLSAHLPHRLVTLIYYVNIVPKQYTGGLLTIWNGKESLKIEPQHNLAVLFPSFVHHEVESVSMLTDAWQDGRFSINYWLGFS